MPTNNGTDKDAVPMCAGASRQSRSGPQNVHGGAEKGNYSKRLQQRWGREVQTRLHEGHVDFFVMSTGFLSVASWKEYNRSTSSSERMPLREKLTAGFSSFLLQTHKGWGDVLAGEKENPSV